jgi:hypothetical protein
MIQSAIKLITRALNEVDNAELVLKIKGVIALFIQTMDASTQYPLICDFLTLAGLGVLSNGTGWFPTCPF